MSRKPTQLRAVSEISLVQDFCKILELPGVHHDLDSARGLALELRYVKFLARPIYAYPWIVSVATHIMADRPTEQLAIDLLMTPDEVFLVRDERNIGGRGLFLAWAGDEDYLRGTPYKGVVNHVDVAGETVRIQALQLRSCLR